MSIRLGIREKPTVSKRSPAANKKFVLLAKYTKLYWTPLCTILAVAAIGISAGATDTLLRGHVVFDATRSGKQNVTAPIPTNGASIDRPQPARAAKSNSNLFEQYGPAANSPAVVASVRKAQLSSPRNAADQSAKASADRMDNLLHGHSTPGTDPTLLLIAGYVPPGMDSITASIVSRGLPKFPRLPRTGPLTSKEIDQLAGMPPSPEDVALASLGISRAQIEAANQSQLERYIRDDHGPVFVPPLQADHNRLVQNVRNTASTVDRTKRISTLPVADRAVITSNHQGSIVGMTDANGNIAWEGSYDPYGNVTTLQGTQMPDFLFHGMYYHQRSGKYLTLNRAYDSALGRWLSGDPLGESAGTNLYAYAGNDPINHVDPLGLDYWLLYDPNALPSSGGPYGHTGSLVGNPTTGYDYFSSSHTVPNQHGEHFNTLAEFQNSEFSGRYPLGVYIPTSPQADQAMSDYGYRHFRDFNFLTNNCSNLSKNIMGAGVIGSFKSGWPSRPKALYNSVSGWATSTGSGDLVSPSTNIVGEPDMVP